MCIYLLRPGAWTPNPRATNFTMLVEGFFFLDIITMHLGFFQIFVGVQKNFFFTYIVHFAYLDPSSVA